LSRIVLVVATAGRKLDRSRDTSILDATLEALAESGYDGMTIDMVAARTGAARATVYRRWPTKAKLVLDAVARMSGSDIDPDDLPDTGSLRGDLAAATVEQTVEEQQLRIKVLTALLTSGPAEPRLAEAAAAGIGPWIAATRTLLQRAVDRGEFPPADVDTLAEVIPMMCIGRAARQQAITAEFGLSLIDGVIIPAMLGGR
jgi:AcrR family transcriptional regulator